MRECVRVDLLITRLAAALFVAGGGMDRKLGGGSLIRREQSADRCLASLEDASGPVRNASALRAVGAALSVVEAAQAALADAVGEARANGHTWTAIANALGVSVSEARRRFRHLPRHANRPLECDGHVPR